MAIKKERPEIFFVSKKKTTLSDINNNNKITDAILDLYQTPIDSAKYTIKDISIAWLFKKYSLPKLTLPLITTITVIMVIPIDKNPAIAPFLMAFRASSYVINMPTRFTLPINIDYIN